jgi:hypothetical protein
MRSVDQAVRQRTVLTILEDLLSNSEALMESLHQLFV